MLLLLYKHHRSCTRPIPTHPDPSRPVPSGHLATRQSYSASGDPATRPSGHLAIQPSGHLAIRSSDSAIPPIRPITRSHSAHLAIVYRPFCHGPSFAMQCHAFVPCICASLHSFIHSLIHSFIHSPIHPSIQSPIRPSVRPSIHPSVHLSICPFVCRSNDCVNVGCAWYGIRGVLQACDLCLCVVYCDAGSVLYCGSQCPVLRQSVSCTAADGGRQRRHAALQALHDLLCRRLRNMRTVLVRCACVRACMRAYR